MQNYIYSTVPLKKIKTVQFGIFSPEEIVRVDGNVFDVLLTVLIVYVCVVDVMLAAGLSTLSILLFPTLAEGIFSRQD